MGLNTYHVIVQPSIDNNTNTKNQSIHIMLLFNCHWELRVNGTPVFKYISCYCSTLMLIPSTTKELCLNTYHVIVQPL